MMNKTSEFFLKKLPSIFYHHEDDAIIYGLASEGELFVYNLLKYFYKKEQRKFSYKQEEFLFGYCKTYDPVQIIKIELNSLEQVKKVYLLFSLDADKEIHSKSYYVTLKDDGQVYCAIINADGGCNVCLEAVADEAEEMQFIVEDYYACWEQ